MIPSWFNCTYRLTGGSGAYQLTLEVVTGYPDQDNQRTERVLASVTSREAAKAVMRLFDVEEYEDLTNEI